MLRTFFLALDHHTRRDMRDAHCRVSLVDVLTAGTGGTIGIDAQVGGVDVEPIQFNEFWENRYGAG